jgi:hypothetical protein
MYILSGMFGTDLCIALERWMLVKMGRSAFRVYAHSSEMKIKRISITNPQLCRDGFARSFPRSDLKINQLVQVLTRTGGLRLWSRVTLESESFLEWMCGKSI